MSIRATVTFINAQASANYVNVSAQDYVVRPQLVNSPFYFDTLPLSDVAVVLLTKPLSDSFAFTDLRIVNLSKLEADSLSFGDSVITATQMQRALSDNFGIGDSVNNINTGVNPTDTTTLLDLLS